MEYVNIGVLGMSGYGKTHLTEALIRPLTRLIIFDYQQDDKFDSYVIVTKLSQLEKILKSDNGENEFALTLRGNTAFFLDALVIVAEHARNCALVFDEMATYAPSRKMPEAMKEIIFRGRRKGYVIIWNSQRPKSVDADVRSQTHAFIVFRQVEALDAGYFELSPQESELLRKLPKGQYRVYRDKEILLKFLRETGRVVDSHYDMEIK